MTKYYTESRRDANKRYRAKFKQLNLLLTEAQQNALDDATELTGVKKTPYCVNAIMAKVEKDLKGGEKI